MLGDTLSVLLIGVSVVFFGLLSLIGIIYLMSFIVRLASGEVRFAKKHGEQVLPEHTGFVPAPARPIALSGEQRRELVAAVSAAIAESMGQDVSSIRIHSIKRVGGEELPAESRRELVAVISAAVATQLGTEVSGIRIHSIRRVA